LLPGRRRRRRGLGSQDQHDEEIAWLEGWRPVLVWDGALEGQIDKLYRARVRRDLDASQIDHAVLSLREARAHVGHQAERFDSELMALGIETFTRAADKMEARGLLAVAAWDEPLRMAIRAPCRIASVRRAGASRSPGPAGLRGSPAGRGAGGMG
jgi:hypothetical protein